MPRSPAEAPPRVSTLATYGGPSVGHGETEAEATDRASLTRLAGLSCTFDPRLASAAREHAEALFEQGATARSSDLDLLRFSVLRSGGADYCLQPFIAPAHSEGIAAVARSVSSSESRRFTHCGLGRSRGEGPHFVLLLSDRVVEVEAFAAAPAPWTQLVVAGSVRSGAQLRSAYLGLPDGQVRVLPLTLDSGRFAVRVRLGPPGRYELELGADLGHGEETALLVPLYVGVSPEGRPVVVPEEDKDATVSADTLLGYINTTRRRYGLRPLLLSASLSAVAQEHSGQMAKQSFFGHVSPTSGDLVARLAEAGVSPGQYAENVARSRTLIRLHTNLKASPSHRMKLLDPGYTHVGIGIARSGDDLVVTEIFATL